MDDPLRVSATSRSALTAGSLKPRPGNWPTSRVMAVGDARFSIAWSRPCLRKDSGWDEAERSLAQAENWIGEHLRDRSGGLDQGVPEGWHGAILMHMLLREARDLVGAKLPILPADVFAPAT
jgi:hypothetical protein